MKKQILNYIFKIVIGFLGCFIIGVAVHLIDIYTRKICVYFNYSRFDLGMFFCSVIAVVVCLLTFLKFVGDIVFDISTGIYNDLKRRRTLK